MVKSVVFEVRASSNNIMEHRHRYLTAVWMDPLSVDSDNNNKVSLKRDCRFPLHRFYRVIPTLCIAVRQSVFSVIYDDRICSHA